MHFRANTSRIETKQSIINYVNVFRDIEDQIRMEDGASANNRNILFDVVTMNKVRRIKQGYIALRSDTESNRTSDSLILSKVNKELELWGIKLEKEKD